MPGHIKIVGLSRVEICSIIRSFTLLLLETYCLIYMAQIRSDAAFNIP